MLRKKTHRKGLKAAMITAAAMILCLPLGGSVPQAFAKGSRSRIVFCDLQRAARESKTGKRMQMEMEKLLKSKSKPLQEKKKELDRLRLELDKKSMVMDEALKKEKEDAYFDARTDLKRMREDVKRALRKKNAEFMEKIGKKLQKIVRELGIDEGYQAILRKEVGLYYAKELDITDLVIKKLDQR